MKTRKRITTHGVTHTRKNTPARTGLLAVTVAATAALALSSCTGSTGGAAPNGTLKVVATTTQLTDFARQIGGDDIALTGLLKPGASAHHFDPTPADLKALADADVLIVNGAGLEGFIDSAVEASGFDGTVIDASQGVDLTEAEEITAEGAADLAESHSGEDHDDADHDHAAEHEHDEHDNDAAEHDHDEHDDQDHDHGDAGHDAAEHDHDHDHDAAEHEHDEREHDHDHDHDHGSINPHLWTSPRFAEGMAAMIAGDLARVDPEHADDYLARADAYLAQLSALDSWVAAQFERIPAADRVLVSGHDSLRYYLHDYGIAFAGSLLPSFEDNAEPSIAETDALIASIRESGVKAIFVESSLSPKLAETVAKETGVAVVASDALYVDSLGGDGSGAQTYVDATVKNTRTIVEAWGGSTDPLPKELE